MPISAARQSSGYGMPAPTPLLWPEAQPGELLDYSLDAGAMLGEAGDTPASVAVAVQPSGSGELQPGPLTVTGNMLTVWLGGGVAGRSYTVRITMQTTAGRSFVWLVSLRIAFGHARPPLPAPPNAGFGAPVTWTYAPVLDFSTPGNSMYLPCFA